MCCDISMYIGGSEPPFCCSLPLNLTRFVDMRWSGVNSLCSSFPKFVFLRLVVIVVVQNVLWLVVGHTEPGINFWQSQNLLASALLGLSFVTGFPLRQISNLVHNVHISTPANRVPGPFLAKASRVWKIWQVLRGDFNTTIRELHRKHGSYGLLSYEVADL